MLGYIGNASAPLPAALDRRGKRRLLHRPRRGASTTIWAAASATTNKSLAKTTGWQSWRRACIHEARRIAANIAKLPELPAVAVGHQKLPAAFSGPARGLSAANGYP